MAQLGLDKVVRAELGQVTVETTMFSMSWLLTGVAQEHSFHPSGVPAAGCLPWPAARRKRAQMLLDFIRERGPVHPKEVDAHFAQGKVKNYWGGQSNATTHLLDNMHYQGLLRVVRRDAGIRVYAAHEHAAVVMDATAVRLRLDALADVAIRIYAPLPLQSLRFVLRRLRFAVPQWSDEVTATIQRAKVERRSDRHHSARKTTTGARAG